MSISDAETLSARAADMMDLAGLTPGERRELMNMAQGVASKEAAIAAGVPIEVIRACRKRAYEKLGSRRAGTLISILEVLAEASSAARMVNTASGT